MQPPFLPHHKSEAKLCREFPEAENPSRHGIARMIDEWIMMYKNPHTDKWDLMN
ncbi:hypothetical protein YC2023_033462 [Brassica napus]